MNQNLLILGAGQYGMVAKEVAESMQCFEKIDFLDDNIKETVNRSPVIGTFSDIEFLLSEYNNTFVAIGNPDTRLKMLQKIKEQTSCRIVTLISPHAYVSPTASIGKGCIIEPMAVVHTGSVLGTGCLISAGAVVNHFSRCADGVHVDCNAIIAGNTDVPERTKVFGGTVYSN